MATTRPPRGYTRRGAGINEFRKITAEERREKRIKRMKRLGTPMENPMYSTSGREIRVLGLQDAKKLSHEERQRWLEMGNALELSEGESKIYTNALRDYTRNPKNQNKIDNLKIYFPELFFGEKMVKFITKERWETLVEILKAK